MPPLPDVRAGQGQADAVHRDVLGVPGAELYYELRGAGPLLVLVPGAAGSVEPYARLAGQLARSYTVAAYDRRGFSRSRLLGDQDHMRRLETDADDVRALIEHVGNGPAAVFGNSSGAIVALEVLIRHPSAVRVVVAHEPPVMLALPDGDLWVEFFSSLYDVYRHSGPGPALTLFRERSFPEGDRQVMAHVPANEFTAANAAYWFEHELRQYPAVSLDHGALRDHVGKLVLAVGHASHGHPCADATRALGQRLGRVPLELPGGHVGFVAHAEEFAGVVAPYLGELAPAAAA